MNAQFRAVNAQFTAVNARLDAIDSHLVRNFNACALSGAHRLEPLANRAGQFPVTAGIWFPANRTELCNMTNARAVALVAYYNLVVPPGAGTMFSRRLQLLKDFIGIRE